MPVKNKDNSVNLQQTLDNTEPSHSKPVEGVTTISKESKEQAFLNILELNQCEVCSKPFVPKKKGQTCCSKKCYSHKWRAENLEHRNTYKLEYYHSQSLEEKELYSKKTSLWVYRMSVMTFDFILEQQGGHCALCTRRRSSKQFRLHVDHNHCCCDTRGRKRTCGKCNRGLLCNNCNQRIARLERNVKNNTFVVGDFPKKWLARAFVYLRKYESKYSLNFRETERAALEAIAA